MIALSTMFEEKLFDKIKKHVSKHKTKYQIGTSLAAAGAGLLARRKGKQMVTKANDSPPNSKERIKALSRGHWVSNIGTTVTLGGAGTALKSGLYKVLSNKIDDITSDSSRRKKV